MLIIKTGYYLELLAPETKKLLGSTNMIQEAGIYLFLIIRLLNH